MKFKTVNLRTLPPIAKDRFWEIDFLRGIAIILMLGFHWIVDLELLRGYQPSLNPFLLSSWQKATAILFLLLAGISLTLQRNNFEKTGKWNKALKRSALILGWSLLITLVTLLLFQEALIVFGVLHLIGVAVIISQPLLHLKTWNLLLGIIITGLGISLNFQRFSFPWLIWAGFIPDDFFSIDYFPLFPWFGVILIGVYLGNILYQNQTRKFTLKDPKSKVILWLCFLGRNSLKIYLLHQPLFIAILFL